MAHHIGVRLQLKCFIELPPHGVISSLSLAEESGVVLCLLITFPAQM